MAATTSSSPPATPASAPDTAPSKNQLMSGCLSCRLLSGVGLLGAGGYVYWTARRPMKLGYYPGPGTILQMVIGIKTYQGARGRDEKIKDLFWKCLAPAIFANIPSA
ncbi:distal membrane-arm assembly complex protein 1 isoform X1 [Gracilinanus agilis]|uniref:distal membrane-arm assembly complex protein 1 isoform X1 n=1 Tax=Gracilinanus agilis TaxID=191870 RepID=UPI001CFD77F3|nr:distal membrane-arm assembly complex protein 1 isoform X1 [Gracilinanus agilis]